MRKVPKPVIGQEKTLMNEKHPYVYCMQDCIPAFLIGGRLTVKGEIYKTAAVILSFHL